MPCSRRQSKRKSKEETTTKELKLSKLCDSSTSSNDDTQLSFDIEQTEQIIPRETEDEDKINLGDGHAVKSDSADGKMNPPDKETLPQIDIQINKNNISREENKNMFVDEDSKDIVKKDDDSGDAETIKLFVKAASPNSHDSSETTPDLSGGSNVNHIVESGISIITSKSDHSSTVKDPMQITAVFGENENSETGVTKESSSTSESNPLSHLNNPIKTIELNEQHQNECQSNSRTNKYENNNMSSEKVESEDIKEDAMTSSLGFDVSNVQDEEASQTKNDISDKTVGSQTISILPNDELKNSAPEDNSQSMFNLSTQKYVEKCENDIQLKDLVPFKEPIVDEVKSVSNSGIKKSTFTSAQIHTEPMDNNTLTSGLSNCDDLQTNEISDSQMCEAFHQTELEQKWDETHTAVMVEIQKKKQDSGMLDVILGELRSINRQVMKFKQEMEVVKRKMSSNRYGGQTLLSKSTKTRQTYELNRYAPGGSHS